MQSKSEIREIFKKNRLALDPVEARIQSQLVNQNFIFNLLPKIYSKEKIFSLYIPASNEVDPTAIANFFKKNNIKFSYPKIISDNLPLQFIAYENEQKFSNNNTYSKILEPESGKIITPDILIIPLVAFDRKLYRLGMGKGFFDKTIANLKSQGKKITTIGLAYDSQRFEGLLPIENTDQRLDFIALPTSLIRANPLFL